MSPILMLRFIAVLIGIACLLGCAGAPVQEMSDARQAIGAARAAGATDSNSPDMYAADAAIARAEQHLQAQEYTRARLAAMQAKRHAGAALVSIQHSDGTTSDLIDPRSFGPREAGPREAGPRQAVPASSSDVLSNAR